jgi:Xaa-Pro aminopeptidase
MDINQKLHTLRKVMNTRGIDATIIPSTDPHQSEYVASRWQEREWISGFTGSAGTVVITSEHAGVWTDSRYWLQAGSELSNSEFILHKNYNQFSTPYIDFLIESLNPGAVVAVNGKMFSIASVEAMDAQFSASNIKLNCDVDLISEIWVDRPSFNLDKVQIHDLKFCGLSSSEKIRTIRSEMHDANVDGYLMTALDDIAWTCNLRGSDVAYNPVFISYMLINQHEAILFINDGKTDNVRDYLQSQGISTQPYHTITTYLSQLNSNARIMVDKSLCNYEIYASIQAKKIEGLSISKRLKAIKNDVELDNVKKVMAKDAVALAKTFFWLENQHNRGKSPTEFEFAEKLIKHRSENEGYVSESFGAIIGYKSNGAIIHYHPKVESSATISNNGILLVDSGGQYADGTTDTTRTISLSDPTSDQKKHYTLILKGMISLSKAIFPSGTTGAQLDTLARQYLWAHGCNYLHGTGHGVGFFLNVHEPPQGFAPISSDRGKTVFLPGMLTSNEPGCYIEGQYGMRIENLIVCKESRYNGFLDFETVTLYPFDIALMDLTLLTSEEIDWINSYHNEVWTKVSPLLNGDIKDWFKQKCVTLQ